MKGKLWHIQKVFFTILNDCLKSKKIKVHTGISKNDIFFPCISISSISLENMDTIGSFQQKVNVDITLHDKMQNIKNISEILDTVMENMSLKNLIKHQPAGLNFIILENKETKFVNEIKLETMMVLIKYQAILNEFSDTKLCIN